MAGPDHRLLVCSCEKTMPLFPEALAKGCPGRIDRADQLCGAQLDLFRQAVEGGGAVTVACTQEAALFTEVHEDLGAKGPLSFVNIRETSGWSSQADRTGPKAAALVAAAAEEMPPISVVTLESRGVVLVYGRDETAIEAGRRLADRLDVTVMLSRPGDVLPPRSRDVPIVKGHVRNARGHLGAFELTVDETALPAPSSRDRLVFGREQSGATSSCDIVLDLTGGLPLFPGDDLRPGYVRADPASPAAVERAIETAAGLVGTFDKPRYVQFTEALCAHARSKITGCTRCLDLCPTGAITPAGDHVAIDANVCAGCGACASVCPTGAASYALPPSDALMRRLRTLLRTYAAAGGGTPVVLLHDGDHGEAMIDALARYGDGLPAHVLPLRVNEVTQVGPELLASAFAFGATGVAILARGKAKHDHAGLAAGIGTVADVVAALGFGEGLAKLVETDDPDALLAALQTMPAATAAREPAQFVPRGNRRSVLETTFLELHRAAPAPVERVTLSPGAPFGTVHLDVAGCTLCHACVGACPTSALTDHADKPMLLFTESLCVQCGLCQATCPEKVIRIEPQIDFAAWAAPARVLKEEEPALCIACGTAFGKKSSIDKVVQTLKDRHWMFSGDQARRIDVIRMCESCRIEAVMNEGFDPHAAPLRPPVMSTEDYLKARDDQTDPLN